MIKKVVMIILFATMLFTAFLIGRISTVIEAANQDVTQSDLMTAIKVLAKKAEIAGKAADIANNLIIKKDKQSDVVVYKNAFNLLARDVSNQSFITDYESFFKKTIAVRIQNDGNFLYCTRLDKNPFVAISVNPEHHQLEEFFRILQDKLEKDEIKITDMTNFLERVKLKELTISPNLPKQKFVVLESKDLNIQQNNIILQPKIDTIKP